MLSRLQGIPYGCRVTSRYLLLAALPVLLLGGCGKKPPREPPTPTPTPVQANAIPVGAFLPLSGSQQAFGQAAVDGVKLAVSQINSGGGLDGRPVHLILRDTNSKGSEAAAIARQLITGDKVVALIGEITSENSLLAAPVAAEMGIPMISPGSTHADVTKAGPGIFRVCFADPFQGRVMSKFARSIGVEKAAVLFDPTDPYSASLAKSFEEDFLARGGSITAKESCSHAASDFGTQLEAVRASQPEVIFLPLYYAQAAAIIKQARPLGIDQPFIGTDGWESPDFLKIGGQAVDNTYFASHFSAGNPSEQTKAFVTAYNAGYGHDPLALAALGYDAMNFLADGIRRAGSTEAGALQKSLSETKDFPGVSGTITLDADRNPAKSAIVLRVSDGKFNYLETVAP
ncbi:MAG: ABC transporter substrate-binding protein [Terrimicrobiaceae bacterium]